MSSTAIEIPAYRPPEYISGTTTSWIPLVTPYNTFAFDCYAALWRNADGRSLVGWDPGYGISVDKNMRCVPEAVTTWWDQNKLGPNSETVVSIGPLTCPEPFTQVTTRGDAPSIEVACCPSEYTFASWADRGKPSQCYSVVGSGTAIAYQYFNWSTYKWEATTETTNTSTTVFAVHINGWIFAEETGSPGSGCAWVPSNTSSEAGVTSRALSNGNAIGIGVGVGMGVVGLATLAAGLFMMRRARRLHRPQHQQEQQKHEQQQGQQQEEQQQQRTTERDIPGWYSSSGLPGEQRGSAAVEDRYVTPPSELYST